MAANRVQQADSGSAFGSAVTSRSVTLGSDPTPGNTLIAIALGGTLSGDLGVGPIMAGWTTIDGVVETASGDTRWSIRMFAKEAEASDTTTITVTCDGTGGKLALWVAEYEGLDASAFGDAVTSIAAHGTFWTGVTALPEWAGGLLVGAISEQHSNTNTPGNGQYAISSLTIGDAHEGATLVGSLFGHGTTVGDTFRVGGVAFDEVLSADAEGPACVSMSADGNSDQLGFGVVAIFKMSGASAATTEFGGTGSGTAPISAAGGDSGTAVTVNWTGAGGTTVGRLLVVGIFGPSVADLDTAPSGLEQLGEEVRLTGAAGGYLSVWVGTSTGQSSDTWEWGSAINAVYAAAEYDVGAAADFTTVNTHEHEVAAQGANLGSLVGYLPEEEDQVAIVFVASGSGSGSIGISASGWTLRQQANTSGAHIALLDKFGDTGQRLGLRGTGTWSSGFVAAVLTAPVPVVGQESELHLRLLKMQPMELPYRLHTRML